MSDSLPVLRDQNIRVFLPKETAAALIRALEQIDEMKAAHRAILDEKPIRGA